MLHGLHGGMAVLRSQQLVNDCVQRSPHGSLMKDDKSSAVFEPLSFKLLRSSKAVVTTTIRLRFARRSTPIRLQFDGTTTVLRHGLPVLDCCTAA